MDSFLGIPIKKFRSVDNNYINPTDEFKLKNYYNILYNCYKNNKPCIISKNLVEKNAPGCHYINNNYHIFIDWNYLIYMNNFFSNRYKVNDYFTTKLGGFYYIFLIKFMFNNKKLYKTSGINLIGIENSLFGIYDNITNKIKDCDNKLYFSYSMNKFIFYKVIDKQDSICGKLMNHINIVDDNIQYKNESKMKLPDTFKKITGKIYSIAKNRIKIISNNDIVQTSVYNKYYLDFLKHTNSRCFFILKSNYNVNKNILDKLYEAIIIKYPILHDSKNNVFINPYNINISTGNLVLILIKNDKQNKIIIDINQYFVGYIKNIYNTILDFFSSLSTNTNIVISSELITFNKDFCIHILSEIVYFYLIMRYSYSIFKNITISDSDDYIQANYTFTEEESIIFRSYSGNNYANYLKCVITSILGTFLDNYYIFIHEGENIDVIPMYEGIDIDTVHKYLNYSSKANYSKYLLISYISKFNKFMEKNNYDIPIMFINVLNIDFNNKLELLKLYGSTEQKSVPIIVNIVYNEKQLFINLSYKKKYSRMKYFFNELIDTILDT